MRAALFALVLAGCGGGVLLPPPRSLDVSSEFTPEQQAEIANSAERWNARTTRPLLVLHGGRWSVLRRQPDGPFVGLTVASTHTVLLAPSETDVSWVSLHELGHVLGLSHVCHGVMWGTNPPPPPGCMADHPETDFTDEDIAECRRVGACE